MDDLDDSYSHLPEGRVIALDREVEAVPGDLAGGQSRRHLDLRRLLEGTTGVGDEDVAPEPMTAFEAEPAPAEDEFSLDEAARLDDEDGEDEGDELLLGEGNMVEPEEEPASFIDDVSEAEVNPLMVKREGEGVVAVDGLIVRR